MCAKLEAFLVLSNAAFFEDNILLTHWGLLKTSAFEKSDVITR